MRINRYPVEPKMDFNRLVVVQDSFSVIDSFDSAGYLAEFPPRHHVPARGLSKSGEEAR